MSQMMTKINTSVKDLKQYFSWLDNEFSSIIKNTCNDFWKISPQIRLFSLEKNSKIFFSGNNYFVTQAQIQTITLTLRLSDTACEAFLTETLGSNNENFFDFSQLTELEANIISKFNNILFSAIKSYLLTPKEIKKLIDKEEVIENYLNLGFILFEDNSIYEMGKLFLSIPEKLIKYPELPFIEGKIDTTKFKKAQTPVDIFVGKTKLSLEEINNIEPEDIVLLEKSNIKKMAITKPTEFEFKVNPDPRLFIKEEENDTQIQKEDIEVSTKDIWDNVQVDVCAKFPQVKMSLGELREMAEGVVVELDSVYGNEVVLEVENKNVAKGELVIIGYKYGVKITEIFSQAEPIEKEENEIPDNSNENDDFDVNDFEIEE